MCPFLGPETVSGGVFQLYFNGFQVSIPGQRHSQCEWFPHSIVPSPGPCRSPGHSQFDYTVRRILGIERPNGKFISALKFSHETPTFVHANQ